MYKSVRWKIGLLMFLGVAFNYLDRVNISHAIIYITKEFNLTNIEKGYILSIFSFGYVLFMFFGGVLIYKFGARSVLFISSMLLSISTVFTGLSSGFKSLLMSRFFVGVFEAPTFPANAYIVSQWFPKKERARATSFFDSGSYIGMAIAAPIIIFLIVNYDWRVCFYISGGIGVLWSIIWYLYYRDNPKDHGRIESTELLLINEFNKENKPKSLSLTKYLKNRKIIGMSIGFFCYNYLKSFHLTWFPIFLVESKGMDFINLGIAAIIPPFFAVLGEIFTGYLIDRLINNGSSPTYAKKIPVCIGLVFSSIIILSIFTSNIIAVITIITLSYMFLISSSVGIWSMPDEITNNKRSVAIIGSIQNTFSNIAGIIAPIITGYLYHYSGTFLLPFLISCFVSLLGAFSYWYIVGELKLINI